MKILLTIFLTLCFVTANATTYYIDQTGGSDAANGTSIGTPWKTIAKVNLSSFLAGDSILFKRGETWREELTIPSSGNSTNDLYIGAYGTGAKPRILGSVILTGWNQDDLGAAANNDLAEESFEGAGYEEVWSEAIGANSGCLVDEDNTAVARPTGGGDQVLKLVKVSTPTATADASKATATRTFASEQASTYSDFYVYINAHGLSSSLNILRLFRGLDDGYTVAIELFIQNLSGNVRFGCEVYYNGDWNRTYSTYNVTLNQWYHVQMIYDVTNQEYAVYIDDIILTGGELTATYRTGIRRIILGDDTYVRDATLYYDLFNVSSTNVFEPFYELPANVWASDVKANDPHVMQYPGSTFFVDNNGAITWGRVKKTTIAALEANYDWTVQRNYVYIYSTSNPETAFSGVEIAQRAHCVMMNNQQFLTIDSLEVAYSGSKGIGELWPATNIEGLTIKNCTAHHIGVKNGASAYGVENWHSHSTIEDNLIYESGRRNISLNIYSGDAQVHDITVQDNELHHGYHTTGVDISGFGDLSTIDGVVVRRNYIWDDPNLTRDGVEEYGSTGIFGEKEGVGTITNIYVYSNIFEYTSSYAILFIYVPNSYIYNNTFFGVDPKRTSVDGLVEVLYPTTCEIKNNIFYNNIVASLNPYYGCIHHGYGGTVTFDYNLYYCSDPSARMILTGGTAYTMAQWTTYKSATGQDAHSPTPANPMLSPTYRLNYPSPAIDAGTTISGVTLDYSRRTAYNAPDIGANEYTRWFVTKEGLIERNADGVPITVMR